MDRPCGHLLAPRGTDPEHSAGRHQHWMTPRNRDGVGLSFQPGNMFSPRHLWNALRQIFTVLWGAVESSAARAFNHVRSGNILSEAAAVTPPQASGTRAACRHHVPTGTWSSRPARLRRLEQVRERLALTAMIRRRHALKSVRRRLFGQAPPPLPAGVDSSTTSEYLRFEPRSRTSVVNPNSDMRTLQGSPRLPSIHRQANGASDPLTKGVPSAPDS